MAGGAAGVGGSRLPAGRRKVENTTRASSFQYVKGEPAYLAARRGLWDRASRRDGTARELESGDELDSAPASGRVVAGRGGVFSARGGLPVGRARPGASPLIGEFMSYIEIIAYIQTCSYLPGFVVLHFNNNKKHQKIHLLSMKIQYLRLC
jgi:hypothetical protein